MSKSTIEWTDKTWNPVTGCTKISAGCSNCYAETMSRRLKGMRKEKYNNGFNCTVHPNALNEPIAWKSPSVIFVCSMSDLFHIDVPFEFIDRVLETISKTPQHIYQILTKRAGRMAEYFLNRNVPDNVWIGVTVENKISRDRIDSIRNIQAQVKFLSCEPLLEDLASINLEGINWVIVGGESGVRARPMEEKWVLNIYQQAKDYKIPFFFKQWGTWGQDGIKRNKKANGKLLNGGIVQEMPKL